MISPSMRRRRSSLLAANAMKMSDNNNDDNEKDNIKLISKRSRQNSVAETAVESVTSNDDDYDDNEDQHQQLLEQQNHEDVPTQRSAFQEQILKAQEDNTSCLTLTNFVADSTRDDTASLRSVVACDEGNHALTKIVFIDTVQGTHYRRWWYKKENLYHHLEKLCTRNDIAMEFRATVEIPVDHMTAKSLVSLLKSLRSDRDVTSLTVHGHLTAETQASCLKSIKNLLKAQDREWGHVQVFTGFEKSEDENEYQLWRNIMEKYMALFGELYELYHIPIDFRPTATAA